MFKMTPEEHLQVDIAGNFGLDKRSWSDRLTWFSDNEKRLDFLVPEADEPALYFAGVQAWHKHRKGRASGYPVSLDATASGAQFLSCLSRCRQSAAHCNVVPDLNGRQDLYTNIHHLLLTALRKVGLPTAGVDLGHAKQATMTALFGSQAEPKKAYRNPMVRSVYFKTLETEIPGVWALNSALLALWDPQAWSYDWVMPDGFNVHIKVEEKVADVVSFAGAHWEIPHKVYQPTDEGRSLGANLVHSLDGMVVREIQRRVSLDPRKRAYIEQLLRSPRARLVVHGQSDDDQDMVEKLQDLHHASGFLSARILDHLTSRNVGRLSHATKGRLQEILNTSPQKPFHMIAVHDCFRVLPNNGETLRQLYNQLLHEVCRSDMLSFLCNQFVRGGVVVAQGADFSADILNADYALS